MGILGHGRESVGIAVKATDVLFVLAWSNVAFTLRGIANLRPKDGGEAVPLTVDAAVTSDRLVSSGKLVIMQDGVIDSAAFAGLGGGPTQRGQTFAQFFITRGGASSIYGVLMAGYVYTGSQLGFGVIEQPGPAGGHGAITRVTKATTAVGAGLVLAVVPTGALWRFLFGNSVYTASATVGTRVVKYRFRDASGNAFAISPNAGPTATQLLTAEFAPNLTTDQSVSLGSAVSDEFPSPDRGLPAGYDLFVTDTSAIDAADTVNLESQVEEWVMPN